MKKNKIYILVLNYNGYLDTIECVESLLNVDYENYNILIIDNNSTDESLEKFREKTSWKNKVEILSLDMNFGYAAGNNKGIYYAIEKGADYICILNNDVVVETDFLSILIEEYKKYIDIGIIGPAICEYSNHNIVQSTGANINIKKGQVPPLNTGIKINNLKKENISCDYVGGACMLFSIEIIKEFGAIPENYFLFFEETEWCYKIKKLGKKIICNTNSRIYHKGSISINKINGLSKYFMERNLIVFVKRNGTFLEKLYFLIFISLKTIKSIVYRKEDKGIIKNYFDGLFNRIDKKFKFVYISNK